MKLKLGFSTGALHKEFPVRKALVFLKDLELKTVELGFVKIERMYQGQADDLTEKDLSGFDYVSIHSPGIQYGKNSETRFVFDKLNRINSLRKIDLVVFHPDTVEDFSIFENLDFPVGFENMDNRKMTYKTPEEIEKLLENKNYSFVLDVNHAYSNDENMNLVEGFYSKSGRRIREIHLSGYVGYHEPLFQTKQINIIESIKDFSIPIVNEAVINSADIEKERDYITAEIEKIISNRA